MIFNAMIFKECVVFYRLTPPALALSLVILVSACAGNSAQDLSQIEGTAEELYNRGLAEAAVGEVGRASILFDEVERQYPYSALATHAQLLSAWSLYEANNYGAAISALDRFVELNPAHPDVDYALYLKAQSYYEQIVDVERDAGMTERAKDAFEVLIARFPDSRYTRDARLKHDLTVSHLAGKHMAIGRFYLQRGHYDAAIRRFGIVIREYDRSSQTPEALYRMVEGYLALGLDSEAERSAAVLVYNYPDSEWAGRMQSLISDPTIDPDAVPDAGRLRNFFNSIF